MSQVRYKVTYLEGDKNGVHAEVEYVTTSSWSSSTRSIAEYGVNIRDKEGKKAFIPRSAIIRIEEERL